ncbi:MAG: trimethylamine methyltransferase family protein [Paracoccaceae bacterium]
MREGRQRKRTRAPQSTADFRRLRNPFVPQRAFSDDAVVAMHDGALRILEDLGMKVLEPEGRSLFLAAGALVDEGTQMVRVGRDIVEAALASAPRSFRLRAADPGREQIFEQGTMMFTPGSGCPNVTDRLRGRRPGSLETYRETLKLHQSFDAIHMFGPSAEPQDVPVALRHYAMMQAQLELGDKPVFVYARGQRQVEDSLEMIRLALGLDEAAFNEGVWASTVINTNSPRQLDVPMTRGIIDFARAGQMSIITPFCLSGAMAPVTISGALMLQHAEALAGITLAQLARPGAPVCYGGFTSNVDMKSGAPAFGTAAHVQALLGTGQLARLTGLPWRSGTGAASNTADAQGATETVMSLWASIMGGATLSVHAAGWLEGGLSFGYEKFITDMEAVNALAALARPAPATMDDLGFDAIAEVAPGGHFFATAHTMARYEHAFQTPLVADLSNFGAWTDAGALRADERATAVWQRVLAEFEPPAEGAERAARLADFIARRSAEGGAPPEG